MIIFLIVKERLNWVHRAVRLKFCLAKSVEF